jgi:hypothetical protein
MARGVAMTPTTIHRIFSMTKPLTSVAAMMLYEEGRFQLDDPITRFLPCFANQRVCTGGARGRLETEPATRDITFRDLLTHTSGLTYDFMHATAVDALYREAGIDTTSGEMELAELVRRVAALPLIAQPGTAWNYSVATDVLGHLVEILADRPFADVLRERVIAPPRQGGHRLPGSVRPRGAARRELRHRRRRRAGVARRSGHEPLSARAAAACGRCGPRLDRRRLSPLLPDAAEQGCA